MRRAAYIASNLVKNAMAPAVIPLRRDRGCFGMDGDLDAVCDVLDRFAPTLAELDVSFDGATVLELGVGRTAEVCAAAVLVGAEHARGVDVEVQLDPGANLGAGYAGLAERLASGGAQAFVASVGSSPAAVQRRADDLGPGAWPLAFGSFAGDRLPLADGSLDAILSKSVLEHVRRHHVRPLLRDLRRVLRPGGVMVHIIDLRDHMRIDGDRRVHGDWLDALRYSDGWFGAMFGNRSTSINRLRLREWRSVLAESGFELAAEHLDLFDLPVDFDRQRLHPRFRSMPDADLRVGFLTVGVRRPAER